MNTLGERINKFKVSNIAEEFGISVSTLYSWMNEDDSDRKRFMQLLVYLEIDLYEYCGMKRNGDDEQM